MATFALSKEKKVQRLVKFIKLLFMLLLPAMWLGQLEETESQGTMPQERRICTLEAEQPVSERTMAHLYSERIAVPVFTTGELSSYHPHHSKPKCLHVNVQKNHGANTSDDLYTNYHSPLFYHVIDYYIYTLEHILI